jgi:hypothetical protein
MTRTPEAGPPTFPAFARSSTGAATVSNIAIAADTSTNVNSSRILNAQDVVWEGELLEFLSELEQQLGVLTGRRARTWPPTLVRHGLSLVKTVSAFADAKASAYPKAQPHLAAARVEAGHTVRKAETVVRDAGPEPGPLAAVFGGTKLSAEHRESCFWVLRTLPTVLEKYLLAFGSGFTTGPAAAKWVETCGVFITQVKRVLAAIEKPV